MKESIFKQSISIILMLLFSLGGVLAQSSSCPEDLIPKRFESNGKMGFVDLFDNWKINPKYFEVSPFENRFAKVRFGDHYGMINCEGKEIVPPEYDELSFFSFGRIWARNNQGWFLWDSSGNKLGEAPYEEYERTSVWHRYTWVKKNSKWHVINESNGKRGCESDFTTIKVLSDTLTLVSDDGYFGVLNHKNCKFKIPQEIVSAQKVSSKFIKLRFNNRKYDIINLAGESILEQAYDVIAPAGLGLARVKAKDQWGLIDPNGRAVLTLEYDSISTFNNGLLALKKSNKWFYVNEKLLPVTDFLYEKASNYTSSGAFVMQNRKWFVINAEGQNIYSGFFDSLHYHHGIIFGMNENKWIQLPKKDGHLIFSAFESSDPSDFTRIETNNQKGIYDFVHLRWRLAADYESVEILNDNLIRVKSKNKYGIVDRNGKAILPTVFNNISLEEGLNHSIFLCSENGKYSLKNLSNKTILETEYPIYRQNVLFSFNDSKKTFVYDENGELVLEVKCDSLIVTNASKSFFILKKNLWTLIDKSGEMLIDKEFQTINILSDQFFAAKNEEGNWAILHSNGDLVIGFDSGIEEVISLLDKTFLIKTKGKTAFINVYGKTLVTGIQDWKELKSGYLAIQKNSLWTIYTRDGRIIYKDRFDSINSVNKLELLKSGAKDYRLSPDGQLSVHLEFEK